MRASCTSAFGEHGGVAALLAVPAGERVLMLTTYDLDEPRTCPAAGAVERDRVLAVPTAREVEVLRLIVRGLTNAEIASS